jgi:hypothetical protein
MHQHRPSAWSRRIIVTALIAVAALALGGAAYAEFPYMNGPPSITNGADPQEGQTLNGQTGLWLFDNGLKCQPGAGLAPNECRYTYAWQRCNADGSGCADVPGRTAYTYALGADDVGKRMRFVEWVYRRDCGATNTQTGVTECHDVQRNGVSALTGLVRPRPVLTPQAAGAPTVAGVAMEDEVVRATGTTWTGPGTISKEFYWQRCNRAGEGCATVDGKTGPTYRITKTDVGSRIRVVEAATNPGGTSYAVSQPTAVVIELRPSAARPTVGADKVFAPNRLLVDQIRTTQSGRIVTVKIRVSDVRGFRITGVLVKAVPTGLLAGRATERLTDSTGWATFRFRASGSGTTYVFASARKKGEATQTGVSSANLFRIRVR